MSSSSSLPSAIEQHEQQDSLSQNTESSGTQSQGVLTLSSTSSQNKRKYYYNLILMLHILSNHSMT
jgi:hypothetical protein